MNDSDLSFLRNSFDILFQNNRDIIVFLNEEGLILDANIQACREFGILLPQLHQKDFSTFLKDKNRYRQLLEKTKKEGYYEVTLNLIIANNVLVPFDITSSLIEHGEKNYLLLVCKNIKEIIDSETQRQFLYQIFRHELLERLQGQIGYSELARKIIKENKEDAVALIDKILRVTSDSINLVQNINILLILKDEHEFITTKISEILNISNRHFKTFYKDEIQLEMTILYDFCVYVDDLFYRIIVNLILRMYEKMKGKHITEITVYPPKNEESRIVLHFEGVILTNKEKKEIETDKSYDIHKLGIIVIQSLVEKHNVKIKIEDIKRSGKIFGTRVVLKVPVIDNECCDQ